ncbi:hypothetical protein LEMLEM_LOCUS1837 [Lemmus lemmus]
MGVTEQNAGKEVVSQDSPSRHCHDAAATLRDGSRLRAFPVSHHLVGLHRLMEMG